MSDQRWANNRSYDESCVVYVGPVLGHLVGNGVLSERGKKCAKETECFIISLGWQTENTFFVSFFSGWSPRHESMVAVTQNE